MAQALYREWRPLTWSEVVGQEHVVRTLQNAVKGERLSHAYLFSGPRGTGKTSTARILAKAVNCLDGSLKARPCNQCEACVAVNEGRYLDLIEIDAASNTSVDDVRDLRDRINFAPNEGRYKVYIVDEVHMLSTAAFNALLKTLEEPPPHAIFILATTEVHKVPATVLSRCQRHEFRRIPLEAILKYLKGKIQEAGYEVEPEALELIARQATGSLRDATSLLDQLLSMGGSVTLERAQEVLGTAVDEAVGDLVQAIVDGDIAVGLEIINRAIDGGIDPRQFARQVVEWLRTLLLIIAGGKHDERKMQQAEGLGAENLLHAMHAFSGATRSERTAWQPGLALELAFMDSAQGVVRPASPAGSSASSNEEVKSENAPGYSVSEPGAAAPGTSESVVEGTPNETPPEVVSDAAASGASESDEQGTPNETSPEVVSDAERKLDPSETGDSGEIPAANAGAPSSEGAEFQAVLDVWPELLAAAYARDPQTQALLNSCKPLGVDENALVLGFQSDLLREKMEKGHSQQIVSEALAEVLHTDMRVRCVLTQDWGNDLSSAQTPPPPEGGMVAAALRDLGAEVVNYGPEIEAEGTGIDREGPNIDEEER